MAAGDSKSAVPIYRSIADALRQQIRDGVFRDGDKVPSEPELARRYNVSRGTARQALTHLLQSGLLTRKQGAGTFVANRKIEQNFLKLMGFTEVLHAHKLQAHAKLLCVEILSPPKQIQKLLELNEGEQTVYIERLRYGDAEPLIIERSYFLHRLFGPLLEHDLEGSSIYELLASETDVRLGQAKQSVEASLATLADSTLLKVPVNSAMLIMKRLIYTHEGQAFEYSEDTYRGDRLKFTIATTPYSTADTWQLTTVAQEPH